MPDLQAFVITPLTAASATMPRWQISFQICDSTTGAVLLDCTGANAIIFPTSFIAASVASQNALMAKWTMDLIRAVHPTYFP